MRKRQDQSSWNRKKKMKMESKEMIFFSRIVAKDQKKNEWRKVIGLDGYQEGNEFQEIRSNWTLVKSINETCTVRGNNAKEFGNVSYENENPVQETELCTSSRFKKTRIIFKFFLWNWGRVIEWGKM